MGTDIQHGAREVEQGRLLLEDTQLFLELHELTVGRESGHTTANIPCSPAHRDMTDTASQLWPASGPRKQLEKSNVCLHLPPSQSQGETTGSAHGGRDMPHQGSNLLVEVCFSSPGCAHQNLTAPSLDCLPYGEQEEQAKYTWPSSSHL